MMKQIRMLMEERAKLIGPVEMDESYFGGADQNKHKHLRGKAKTAVFGIVERRGYQPKVVARVVTDTQKETLLPIVAEVVYPKAMIYTDQHKTYEGVRWMGLNHKHTVVNHSIGQYVDGFAHTNTIEGFWSLVKRGISGVYHRVGAEYLQSYINEYTFRYNRRKLMRPMFSLLAERTVMQVCPSAYETKRLALRA